MSLARRILLRASVSPWLARQMSERRAVQRAVKRFMPGEELSDAVDASRQLRSDGMSTILTLLGENVETPEDAMTVADAYAAAIEAIAGAGLPSDLSVKPTHLGLDLGLEIAEAGLRDVVTRAGAAGRLVAIDMESSGYVDDTLELYRRLRADHENVGLCLQAYLYRTEQDLADLLPLQPMIRLVKGAYREPEDVAWPRKADVDAAYLERAGELLEAVARDSRVRAAFGTHDAAMIEGVKTLARDGGLERDAFEIQMLYGIRRDLQRQLASEGHAVRVLVSYGTHWFPWYMRRLAERPANTWFVVKSLLSRT
ncbi:MAG: proline dehydrogenase family protein [Gemmatimonadales bacterium]|jgi:proline dehydrogenase